jgi:HSP20 family molecular chaperone IbpA
MATNETAIAKKESNGPTAPERIEVEGTYYQPLVDVLETPDAFVFQADVPGVKAEDVEISCEEGQIGIRAKVLPRQPQAQPYLDREYGVGDFYRSFVIGAPIKPEAIKAELKGGVLTLTVPKAESAKTRKIPVKTA